jgi:hypothetical protein
MITQMKLIQLNLTANFFFILQLSSECFSVRGQSFTSHLLAFLQRVFLPEFYNTNIKIYYVGCVWAKIALRGMCLG